jgi:hypothetical protein
VLALRECVLPAELHARMASAMRSLCFPYSESPTLPALPLLLLPTGQTNVLGSFLDDSPEEVFARFLGADDAHRFSNAQILVDVEATISRLETDPNNVEPWLHLSAYLGILPPPEPLRARFRTTLLATKWGSFLSDEKLNQAALYFLTSQASNFPDQEVLAHFRTELAALYSKVAESVKAPVALKEASSLLANATHFLAMASPDQRQRADDFALLTGEMCARWQRGAADVRLLLWPMLLRQPGRVLSRLWPAMFKLRAS